MSDPQEQQRLESHLAAVVNAIRDRRVIPFLGAGASVCDRPRGARWTPTQNSIVPNAGELTSHLATKFNYPRERREELALARVSQYVATKEGLGPLYEELQWIFDKDYQPTSMHHFLAGLPTFLRDQKGLSSEKAVKNPLRQRLVIVTTNFDDLLERAFDEKNEPYHKLVYMADPATYAGNEANFNSTNTGRFLHWTPDNNVHLIENPNEYIGIEKYGGHGVEEYPTVIVKLHGAVERDPPPDPKDQNVSYVITEDDYIDYLTRSTDISTFLPQSTVAVLRNSQYLFLGYSLRDWNLRVILRRIWKDQRRRYNSWAVQVDPGKIDKLYWDKQNVDIFDKPLADYVDALQRYMGYPNV